MSDCSCRAHGGFLTEKGFKEAAQRELALALFHGMGLTRDADAVSLDTEGSVSGLELERDMYAFITDKFLEDQSERFHNGS